MIKFIHLFSNYFDKKIPKQFFSSMEMLKNHNLLQTSFIRLNFENNRYVKLFYVNITYIINISCQFW